MILIFIGLILYFSKTVISTAVSTEWNAQGYVLDISFFQWSGRGCEYGLEKKGFYLAIVCLILY